MNILTSLEWLKEYVELDSLSPEQIAARLSLSGPGVERLYPQGKEWEKIVIGHVTSVEPHPNADKLRVATVDVGTETLKIVCGGSNLVSDQWVVVALIGARVKWHGEGELIELKPIELRGVASEGMICAANEVGLGEAFPHGEREILDIAQAFPEAKLIAGQPLAVFLSVDQDVVFDAEVTTNRPDAMCMQGFAREIAVVLEKTFKPVKPPAIKEGTEKLIVKTQSENAPRFMAVRIDGVRMQPSPWWIKRRLLSAGERPINNLVDITNYLRLELGQPMHVYDANKLAGSTLVAKQAEAGEELKALDGKTYLLDKTMLVIADAEKTVGIAGIMGGADTAVSSETTSVVFEAATFNEVSIRRSARLLNLHSDSQSLYEKGLSTEALPTALARAVELCLQLAGGEVVSNVADARVAAYKQEAYSVSVDEVNTLIGVSLPVEKMEKILTDLGFTVEIDNKTIRATVPWWRDHDIESGRDLVEEIARVYGYANIPPIFPAGMSASFGSGELVFEDRLKTMLKGFGFTELMNYSFVSRDLLEKAQTNPEVCLRVQNPLSSDFEYMRPSLLPSLVLSVADNQERFPRQHVFELSHIYLPRKNDLPEEISELAIALCGASEAWNRMKGRVEAIFRELGITIDRWQRLEGDPWWHPGRSLQAMIGDTCVATIGEWHPKLAERWKLNAPLAIARLSVSALQKHAQATKAYQTLPLFPESPRDLALVVDEAATIEEVENILQQASTSGLLRSIHWFDVYRGQGVAEGRKSLAFHLTFAHPQRTLETAEVDAEIVALRAAAAKWLKADERS